MNKILLIALDSRNLNLTKVIFPERDPNSKLPPPMIGGFRPTVIGEEPPPFIGLDDLCPPHPKCQDCEEVRCEGSARMYGLTILPYDSIFPGLPNRTEGWLLLCIQSEHLLQSQLWYFRVHGRDDRKAGVPQVLGRLVRLLVDGRL